MKHYPPLELDEDELWFLLSQYGSGIIVGVQDPYNGRQVEEIRAANETAFQSLVQRGILQLASENEVFLAEWIISLLGVCHHPVHSLIVQYQVAGGPLRRTFTHYGENLIVKLFETKPHHYYLRVVPDQEALLDLFDEALCSNTGSMSVGRGFQLTANALFIASDLCTKGDPQRAEKTLTSAGLQEEQAQRLTISLYKPVRNTSVIVIAQRNTAETQFVRGFSILEGADDLWIMDPYDENGEQVIAFIPANAEKVRARFLEILPRRSAA